MRETNLRPLPKNRFLRGAYLMVQRYLRHNVAIQSAALAFYLLFMLFPFMIFISALLGVLQLDVAGIIAELGDLLPREIGDFIKMYLNFVGENPSIRLMFFGLFFSIYFPMRATNVLMRAVRTAYHLGPPHRPTRHLLKTLSYTILLIVTISLTLTLMTIGDRILLYAVEHLHLPTFIASTWMRLRFPAAAIVAYFALYFLYAMAQDTRQPWRNIYPGTLAALAGWMLISFLYSLYLEHVAHYSLLYGSIGTLIVLLVWLYMTAITLIMGAEFNGTLLSMRRDEAAESI